MNIRLKVKCNEFNCIIIYYMKIFNIIVILSISGKELFHFGIFRPSKKNKKIDFNWVTIDYEDKNPTIFRNNYFR